MVLYNIAYVLRIHITNTIIITRIRINNNSTYTLGS